MSRERRGKRTAVGRRSLPAEIKRRSLSCLPGLMRGFSRRLSINISPVVLFGVRLVSLKASFRRANPERPRYLAATQRAQSPEGGQKTEDVMAPQMYHGGVSVVSGGRAGPGGRRWPGVRCSCCFCGRPLASPRRGIVRIVSRQPCPSAPRRRYGRGGVRFPGAEGSASARRAVETF